MRRFTARSLDVNFVNKHPARYTNLPAGSRESETHGWLSDITNRPLLTDGSWKEICDLRCLDIVDKNKIMVLRDAGYAGFAVDLEHHSTGEIYE